MGTTIRHPQRLEPAELDRYLAMGWRPSGQSIYSADYIQLEPGHLIAVIPTRLPLQRHSFGKRQRKLMRRNESLFDVRINPQGRVTAEKRRVNDLYRLEHPDKSLELIEYHLAGRGNLRVFDTWETEIYHNGRLVAFSFFDMGEKAAYSKAGIYDPAYSRYSLGLYTLLLEVQICCERNMAYFYPGYVAPEDPVFDYKHKIGPLEYWNLREKQWLPYATFQPAEDDPLVYNARRIEELHSLLAGSGLTAAMYQYPYLDIRFMLEGPSDYLDYPYLLYLSRVGGAQHWIATYNNESGLYYWLEVMETGYYMMERLGRDRRGRYNFVEPLSVLQTLGYSRSPEKIAQRIQAALAGRGGGGGRYKG